MLIKGQKISYKDDCNEFVIEDHPIPVEDKVEHIDNE